MPGHAPHVTVGDDWLFVELGAIGAVLEPRGEELVLTYRFPPDFPAPPAAVEGFPVSESPDVRPAMTADEVADVVEARLARHQTVKRLDDPAVPGAVRAWALSERSASPGLDQPDT